MTPFKLFEYVLAVEFALSLLLVGVLFSIMLLAYLVGNAKQTAEKSPKQ
jgi:hypothetical protein